MRKRRPPGAHYARATTAAQVISPFGYAFSNFWAPMRSRKLGNERDRYEYFVLDDLKKFAELQIAG
ncbi:MAG: hypothetical protein ACJ8FQ_19780 [Rhizobium sp.]